MTANRQLAIAIAVLERNPALRASWSKKRSTRAPVGRMVKIAENQALIRAALERQTPATVIAREVGVALSTVYDMKNRILKEAA